jgi:rfaE bifunctional protein kinase chain/domain
MPTLLNPKDINILVIGDIMLDIYNYGDAHRISPEAPVPVFHSKEKKYYLGGAANTYANLCNIGVNAHLFGVIGDDNNGEIVKRMINTLSPMSLNHILHQHNGFPTITKERIVARSQQIVRIDTEVIKSIYGHQVDLFADAFDNLSHKLNGIDAIIISDYGKGMISQQFMSAMRHDPLFFTTDVYIDPYPLHKEMYSHSFCITPNIKEFEEIGSASYIMDTLKINNIVGTAGENGINVFRKEGNFHVPTEVQTVYDVSGAGDTVIAALAATKAMGFSFMDSVILANRAAGNVVSQMGTTAVDPVFMKEIIREASYAGNYAKSS